LRVGLWCARGFSGATLWDSLVSASPAVSSGGRVSGGLPKELPQGSHCAAIIVAYRVRGKIARNIRGYSAGRGYPLRLYACDPFSSKYPRAVISQFARSKLKLSLVTGLPSLRISSAKMLGAASLALSRVGASTIWLHGKMARNFIILLCRGPGACARLFLVLCSTF
jgi:hypothetical protein